MSEERSESPQIDHNAVHHLVDRIVAANLTTAIYTRLNTLQTQEDYDEDNFDEIARDVVREVTTTYTALLSVFQKNAEDAQDDTDNGR